MSRCCKFRWINNTDVVRTSLTFWQCMRSLVLCVHFLYVLLIIDCPFVLFLLAIVLSVLLRHTDSDYPFGIFKLFLIHSTFYSIPLLSIIRSTAMVYDLKQSHLHEALVWDTYKNFKVHCTIFIMNVFITFATYFFKTTFYQMDLLFQSKIEVMTYFYTFND
jgi:hypothetical protein